ncbi:hypothetical protein C723_3039 [Christiangramia flava JLT2011]|uniref:Uncharacterized protein n=1 Tax=Christiangramia flava JLT2011 TaxID=1229726 RepID=A0A1L7I0G3_9FLAO|nr:hypothetical protein GRFL_0363 [Christiangramia flava JLT2011]OSS38140.1 hypothetical protein C723_3039 [Christiangramia flava JLT2011]
MEVLLKRLLEKLEDNGNCGRKKFYRNKDLKDSFGLSPNTIIKYREEGILPFTVIGEIYLYPVIEVNNILKKNAIY